MEAKLEDMNGDFLYCIWFNQLFIAKALKPGTIVTVTGNSSVKNGKVSIVSGSNMDQIQDVVTGLPASDHDHGTFVLCWSND